MRRLIGTLCCLGLLVTGCSPSPGPSEGTQQEQQKETKAVSIDDLLASTGLSMNTKLDSDLPKTWNFKGEEAKVKLEKLVPVLKQGKELPPDQAINTQHNLPMVIFIFNAEGGNKRVVNVFADRFEFGGKWYQLDQAPEKTYGSINKLEK
jgi:hypothetical protein